MFAVATDSVFRIISVSLLGTWRLPMPLRKLKASVAVTSTAKKLNFKDWLVAWGGSACATIAMFFTSFIKLLAIMLDSITDYILLYLQQVPRQDRPVWLAFITFVAMGFIILNKRRISGKNYVPPNTIQPWQRQFDGADAMTRQPLPQGVPPDTSKSAF